MNEPSSADLPDNGNKPQSFDDIVRVKAANQSLLEEQRAVWFEIWEALSPTEKGALNKAFGAKARETAAQFGRSQPYVSRKIK
ncbi:hypothetical protein SON66_16025 [Pseudomonas syringae]|uniref:hypothetical protein n=1 Tax=Pseudomonas syringae TaxID=317 RepID=UPI0003FB608A|nr:hypothetical protein [Pseudomonas syringae]MDY2564782.1 hypothetical protein [Pseudomonas syringae]